MSVCPHGFAVSYLDMVPISTGPCPSPTSIVTRRVVCRVVTCDTRVVPGLPPGLGPADGETRQGDLGGARRRLRDAVDHVPRIGIRAGVDLVVHVDQRRIGGGVEVDRQPVESRLGGIDGLLVAHGFHADPDVPRGEIEGDDPHGQQDQVGQQRGHEGKAPFVSSSFHSDPSFIRIRDAMVPRDDTGRIGHLPFLTRARVHVGRSHEQRDLDAPDPRNVVRQVRISESGHPCRQSIGKRAVPR